MLGSSSDKSRVNGKDRLQEQPENGRGERSQPSRRERPLSTLPIVLTVMGDCARIEGKFEIPNSIMIECEIEGELTVGGNLIVGEKGVVNADVQTVNALIEGKYQGNLKATGTVEIAATSEVSGSIEADCLIIVRGASFTGNVTRPDGEEPSAAPIKRLEAALATNQPTGT